MQKIILYSIAFWMCSIRLFSQNESPSYHPPLKIPLILAGNFGELRPNHFHMGLDFKTQGKEGLELHAVEDGYVSRVKVATYGYGKVVYVDHPNGKTSVYAHCSKFAGKLDSIVRNEQYRMQKFEVELFPAAGEISLKKGEVFAFSGNTGGSTAPHLHFEIRDTKTEHAQNPLIYAFDLPDKRAPELRKVKVFAVNEQGYLIPGKSQESSIVNTKTGYLITGDTIKIPASFCSSFGGVGLAFDIIDRLDAAENQCGLYGTYLIVDGDTVFGQRTDEISFDNSRYVNSHRDLSAMGSQYHKSFRNVSNPLEIYLGNQLGVIHMLPGQSKQVQLTAYDPKGNTSKLLFVLQALPGEPAVNYNPASEKYWYPEEPFFRSSKTWEVKADSFSIYEPFAIAESAAPHICNVGTPLQKRVTVRMRLDHPKTEVSKYYIAVGTSKGGKKALSTQYKDGWLEAKTNTAGNFSVQTDEIPPVIKPVSSSVNVTGRQVRFVVTDAHSGIETYNLYINGEWKLLEYEYKGNYMFFDVPDGLMGEHEVKLVVGDACGNVAEWLKKLNFILPK